MNSPSSIFEMPQFIVVGHAFFRNFKILFLALYLPPYAHFMPWTKLQNKKSDQWELVFVNSGTTFDPTSKKKKMTHVQCIVTVQNAQ
jgi:hypothetical protein